ncbi:hypothetical protein X728_28895 [Mesorhizobium sp. L103C120A0]|nr:hypothetical protein X728_28895 [Mesorhizobium sp. L103C120A0]
MTMADKIVVMHNGAIEQIGAPLEVYDRPANPFVAQFIGSPAMNIFRGRMDSQGRSVVETAEGISLPVANAPAGLRGRQVVYGIRPEHISLDPKGLGAEIVVVEPTGPETQVTLRMSVTCH